MGPFVPVYDYRAIANATVWYGIVAVGMRLYDDVLLQVE